MGNIFGKWFGNKTKDLRNIKVIFSDIDGTLYNRQGRMRDETITLANALKNSGVELILATGREHQVAEEALSGLGFDTPIISLDGAMVRSGRSGEILYSHPIDEKLIAALAGEMKKYKVSFTVITPDGNVYNNEPDLPSHLQHPDAKFFKTDSLPENKSNFLRMYLTGNRAFITSLYDVMKKKLRFPEQDISTYESRRESGKFYIEIKPATANKGAAVSHILQLLGFKNSEAAGIGDYRNDIEMLKACGYRVAMSDAVAELRDMADHITGKNCDEGGIEEFFQMVLKAKRNGLSR